MSRYGGQQSHDFGYGDRYDRLTNYGNTRSQSSSGHRPVSDNMYDEHYGRGGPTQDRGNERRRNGGHRNMPREMHHQYRGREDKRSGGYRGANAPSDAGGLLGASPNEPPAPNTGAMGGNSTQQQLAAAMQAQQTQNLLAIIQAQQLSTMNAGSLLPTPPGANQRGKGAGRFNERNRQPQPLFQKRRGPGPDQGPYMKRRRDDRDNRPSPRNSQGQSSRQQKPPYARQSQQLKPKRVEGEADDVTELGDDGQQETKFEEVENLEIPQELIGKIEELRKRTKIDRNIADQDVDKLAAFHFDGQNYRCELCRIVAQKYKSIKQHFMGKKHSFNVVEARQAGNDVDRDIMDIMLHPENWLELNPCAKTILKRQTAGFLEAKKKEEEEFKIKHPENYVMYRMDTRKSAINMKDSVVIRHVCESIVSIKDFAGEKQLFGCEFIKAASGFDCRLCKELLNSGTNVVDHIRTEKHISAYQKYLEEHGGYHDEIVQKNKDIVNVLNEHEGKEVILYEAYEEENEKQQNIEKMYIKKDDPEFVRIEKPVGSWSTKDDTAEEEKLVVEEDVAEESYQKEENYDDECEAVLDEDMLGGEYDENVLNGEEDQLLEDEPSRDDEDIVQEEGMVGEEREEKPEEPEELYEPSEPTVDKESDANISQDLDFDDSSIEEPAQVAPKKPVPVARPSRSSPAAKVPRGRRGMPRGGAGRGSPRLARGAIRSQQRSTRNPREKVSPEEKFEVIDELTGE